MHEESNFIKIKYNWIVAVLWLPDCNEMWKAKIDDDFKAQTIQTHFLQN